jgi:hypothetical protein
MTISKQTFLWLLRPVDNLPDSDNPWHPWYDKCFGFVVRANSEEKARTLAHRNGGDENRGEFLDLQVANSTTPWLDPQYSTCEKLEESGISEIVISDYRSA